MSAAIAQIDARLARTHARLKALHWESEARKAENEAACSGDGLAAMAWARVCEANAKAWKEEAER